MFLATYMDIDDVFMMFAVLIGIMVISLIVLGIAKSKQDRENDSQPIEKDYAKLVDKQQLPANGIVVGEMWVLFEVKGGRRVRLNAKIPNSLVIGDAGVLTWQGSRIIGFERNATI